MLTVDPHHVALFCFAVGLFISGILIGGFVEWNKEDGSQDLRCQLGQAQREAEELREYIWLITAGTTTPPQTMTAGVLPTQSVEVEHSRHPKSVESSE
jgi:hypothetical protein